MSNALSWSSDADNHPANAPALKSIVRLRVAVHLNSHLTTHKHPAPHRTHHHIQPPSTHHHPPSQNDITQVCVCVCVHHVYGGRISKSKYKLSL